MFTPRLTVIVLASLMLVSCKTPLDRTPEEALRESLIAQHRKQIEAKTQVRDVTVSREPSDVENELTEERRAELDELSGMSAYKNETLELGDDLTAAAESQIVELSLERAVQLAIEHNLDLAVAQLRPAIAQKQVEEAQAIFDAVFFAEVNWQKLDTPQPGGSIPGLSGDTQEENLSVETGLRKQLTTGGTFQASTVLNRPERVPSVLGTPRFYDSDVLLSLSQPLLRGAGSEFSRAEIVLAETAQQSEAQALRQTLLDLVAQTQQAYWNLAFARQQLLVQKRLYERTVEDRDRLKNRADFDVTPVQITEANSFVELRRGEVIRARQLVRDASDELKRLINSDDLSVADETLVVPTDIPPQDPITFNLLDSVTTALRERPQMQQALLAIKDASVRQRVADSLRLPVLDLSATVGFNGLSTSSANDAYENLGEADYIDYILGARFEMPIGNRGPKAAAQRSRLVSKSAVIDYQRVAQAVVVEVKVALRTVRTSYELIGSARAARRAAADSLRAIEEQEAAGVALTPEFLLDLKLSTQQRVADAEIQEVAALRDYNNAIAELYRVTGTLLDRNGIAFEDFTQP